MRVVLKIGRLLPLFLFCAAGAQPPPFSGRVTAVVDGDTIEVLHAGRAERVRLAGIDCPETGQDFSVRAKQLTSQLAFDRTVTVKIVRRDEWKRVVGWVILPDGRSLNHELVRAGLAWWYRRYAPRDNRLKELEAEARLRRRGVWSRADSVAPWDFRRKTGK